MNKLQSAINYAQQGFYVLPMHGKQPLVKFANQPPLTIDQIKYYWSKWPEANIALRTVNFFVVDVDTKNGHGVDGTKSLKELANGVVTPTTAQKTASGGLQLFYTKPKNSNIKQVIGLKPGIDIKAHINNYVVVPPSTTNKGQYVWVKYEVPFQYPSPQLVKLIADYQPPTHKPNYHSELRYKGKTWAGRILDNLVTGAPQGQRNDYLTRLCGQMIRTGAEDEHIYELLNFANQYNTPPLANKEVETIMTSVLREELNNHR